MTLLNIFNKRKDKIVKGFNNVYGVVCSVFSVCDKLLFNIYNCNIINGFLIIRIVLVFFGFFSGNDFESSLDHDGKPIDLGQEQD